MTGPEHYREAEKILTQIDAVAELGTQGGPRGPLTVAENAELRNMATMLATIAQVHATLALAAATAGTHPEWHEALHS